MELICLSQEAMKSRDGILLVVFLNNEFPRAGRVRHLDFFSLENFVNVHLFYRNSYIEAELPCHIDTLEKHTELNAPILPPLS